MSYSRLYTSRTDTSPSLSIVNSPSSLSPLVCGAGASSSSAGPRRSETATQSAVAAHVASPNDVGGVNCSRPTTSSTEWGGSMVMLTGSVSLPGR